MNLLFVCTHNACRSILAEAITRATAGDRIRVASAGSHPAGRIHPLTVQYLAASGLPADGLHSKGFGDLGDFRPDVVVTACDSAAKESCPVWLAYDAITVHWGLPDPSHLDGSPADREAAFQAVSHTLEARIRALLDGPFETMDSHALKRLLDSLGQLD